MTCAWGSMILVFSSRSSSPVSSLDSPSLSLTGSTSSIELWFDPGSASSSGTGSMVQQACHFVVCPVSACAWCVIFAALLRIMISPDMSTTEHSASSLVLRRSSTESWRVVRRREANWLAVAMRREATMNLRKRWLMTLSCLRMSRCSRSTRSTPALPSSTSTSSVPAKSSRRSP
ncbi:Os06g0635250 [Oryza sativa Japonica Group]|uniref:Os06g0635250 protein n=1 Tax=Oryza sativa subsp. japonica TaxID=39947 RepID=A0A0P0WYZ0_ORYSJ|nr:hypothetical protein EE612_035526 [Oryza sativa]BAS98759.1 Os06g0635250 [Oryza sativa Japonica Group]